MIGVILALMLCTLLCLQAFCSIRPSENFVQPLSPSSQIRNSMLRSSSIIPLALGVSSARAATNDLDMGNPNILPNIENIDLPLGKDAYTTLGDMSICKLLNGMWQVSGIHGYEPSKDHVVADMARCVESGYTTFDLADIYGPAEEFVGEFVKGKQKSSFAKYSQFFTKWVPRPQEITRKMASDAISRSLLRMKTDSIDLLQFHWWDYQNKYYYDAADYLISLQEEGKIRNLGLTNFDTEHMSDLVQQGMPVISNQVSFSILDTRPQKLMIPYCEQKNIKLLCYGTLLGGFISSSWLNKPEPSYDSLTNVSLRKYLPWIQVWGGWGLFQTLLLTLNKIALKYNVSLSTVALRWVLDQPAVGGAIVGVRLGLKQHLDDNKNVFSFKLDEDDLKAIAAIQNNSKDLIDVFGDCGAEYRRRA